MTEGANDWFRVQPNCYRKIKLLAPDWPDDFTLEHMHFAAASFGGPVAAILDQSKYTSVGDTANLTIYIFETSGRELGKILWNRGKLIAMGWSRAEELVCVQEEASVSVYSICGVETDSYQIVLPEVEGKRIMEAKVFQNAYSTGVAVVSTLGHIFIKDTRISALRNLPYTYIEQSSPFPVPIETPGCWEIVVEDTKCYCLIGSGTDLIKLCSEISMGIMTNNLFPKKIGNEHIIKISHNQQHLALYTSSGHLWLGSIDMSQIYGLYKTNHNELPLQIKWIMNLDSTDADAVIISYKSDIMIVNRHMQSKTFSYICGDIFLVSEVDGVRIITENSHELIQVLPECVKNIFSENSEKASRSLFQANQHFERNSIKSDEFLRKCRSQIDLAVNERLEAASYEFSIETQKSLLKAAYLGKGYISSHDPAKYMRTLRILRVLNALRNHMSLPITLKQFSCLRLDGIINLLANRQRYNFVLSIIKYLKKFEYISYSEIAEKLFLRGHKALAKKLLNEEPQIPLQVMMFLNFKEHNLALTKAELYGHSELLILALLEIQKTMMPLDLIMISKNLPLALKMYKNILLQSLCSDICDIYITENDHKSIAEYHFLNAIKEKTLETKLPVMKNGYTKGNCFAEATLCADTLHLMVLQRTLSTKHRIYFSGTSVHDTMLQLLRMGEQKEAEKIKSDFQVPDRRYWWLRIRTMAENHKWDDLEKFSKSKKSPIGYEPFVEVCMEQENAREARKYIARCRDDRMVALYIRAKLYEDAVNCAFRQKNTNILDEIIEASSFDADILKRIDNYKEKQLEDPRMVLSDFRFLEGFKL